MQDEIKLFVKLQHYATVQEAITRAITEEKIKGSLGNNPRYSNLSNHHRRSYCQKCEKMGHSGQECRTRYADRHLLPKPSRQGNINTVAKYCNYCKKTGHIQMLDVKWTLRNGIRGVTEKSEGYSKK